MTPFRRSRILIEAAPHDVTLRQQRAELLKQVGLLDAADYDLRR